VLNTPNSNGLDPTNFALLTSNGTLSLSVFMSSLTTKCNTNIKKWPYNVQSCQIILGSTQSDLLKLRYKPSNTSINSSGYIPNKIWDLINSSILNIPRQSGYSKDLQYSFTLKRRRPEIYILSSIFPCLILNAIILMAFFMPFVQQVVLCI
jgi:hypothetical protein